MKRTAAYILLALCLASATTAATSKQAGQRTRPWDEETSPGLSPEERRAWQECQEITGYANLRKSFDVERAMIGSINMFPESLHVALRATQPGAINAVCWWNPLDSEHQPTVDWNGFLKLYDEALKVVTKQTWLRDWRSASPGRLVELHAFGKSIGETDFDLENFILPLWREAGLAGEPAYSLFLRRGDTEWATLYLGNEDARALVASVSRPEDTPSHWLDGLRVYYHPRCKFGEESSRYVVVQPSGEWELRTVGRCEP